VLLELDASEEKPLTQAFGVSTDTAHSRVDNCRVQNETVELFVLVDGEHPAALVSVSLVCWEKRERSHRVPLLQKL
jgi:hypothetical protein